MLGRSSLIFHLLRGSAKQDRQEYYYQLNLIKQEDVKQKPSWNTRLINAINIIVLTIMTEFMKIKLKPGNPYLIGFFIV